MACGVAPDINKALADDTSNNSDNDVTLTNPIETTSSNRVFCELFSGWLKNTEGNIDKANFVRLKGDLLQLVGKYELEFSVKKI